MLTTAIARLVGVLLVASACLVASRLPAQQAGKAKQGSAPPAKTAATASSSDAAAKAKIMASDAWQQMAAGYQQWLNTQVIYTSDDINRINANLAAQVQSMPSSEMQEYLNNWQAKLKVLNGKDFQEAQQWLGQYMSALSDGYRNKTLKDLGLTDVANMTADQLENSITQIRADRLSNQRNQAAYNRSQQQQDQAIQQANAATQQAQQQESAQLSAQVDTVQSPYRPTHMYNPAPAASQSQFYVDGSGHVGYTLPF